MPPDCRGSRPREDRSSLHTQGGISPSRAARRSLSTPSPGECLVLVGRSGAGKSTLLRSLYGNYLRRPTAPSACATPAPRARLDRAGQAPEPRTVLDVRRRTRWASSASSCARIPRVSAVDVVADPLQQRGTDATEEAAPARRTVLLERAGPSRAACGTLPPATFSGGEQQRVNIARGLIGDHPILLLDEPTASLDADNRAVVIDLIREALAEGRALIGIFHDEAVRDAVATRLLPLQPATAIA